MAAQISLFDKTIHKTFLVQFKEGFSQHVEMLKDLLVKRKTYIFLSIMTNIQFFFEINVDDVYDVVQKQKGQNMDQNKRTSYVFYNYFPLIYIMSRVEGKFELELMKGYEQQFRERLNQKVSLTYDCLPLNREEYQSRVSQVLEQMKLINPTEKDLSLYDQIILGRIEGKLGTTNFKEVIQAVVGEVAEQKIKLYLKQKTQQRTYGVNGKDKMSIVRQVKKLQSLKKYFNLQQINKKRKYNKLYSTALKNLAKYFELYDKIDPNNGDSIKAAFQQYTNYTKQYKKFNNFVKQLEEVDMKSVVEKPIMVEEKMVANSGDNINQIEQEQKIDQQQLNQTQDKGKQSPQKNDKKQNQQKQNKTSKKNQKSNKNKPQKTQQTIENQGQATQKEKIQSENKTDKQKTQKKQEKQKTVKKPTITSRSITQFFVVKKKETTQQTTLLQFKTSNNEDVKKVSQGQQQQKANEVLSQNLDVKNSIWQKFSLKGLQKQQEKQQLTEKQSSTISMSQLRSQFRSLRMESQQYNPLPYYTNIIMTLSTLEYFNYYMAPTPIEINFSNPYQKIEEVLYFEDESQQFEGQSANEEQQQQDEMEEGSMMSDNNTILSDDHLSNQELSSCEPYQVDIKVEYGKGTKWVFGQANKIQSQEQLMHVVNTFSMICLQDYMPLVLQQQEDNSDKIIITPEMWRDVYKMAHGYYGTKQLIIKEILNILPGVSKTWIDTMLKERSQKLLNQRFIKKEFIQDIKQKIPEIQEILQSILNQRNQQLRKLKAQKNFEKDQKLQKDILQCTGSRYIVNLLKQLKQKGYKQLRRTQLIEFINERRGEQWEKIKIEINTMSRPIVQMLRVMNTGEERIDQEVVVQDEEYNNNGVNNQEVNKNIQQKVGSQKKTKKTLKQKQQKLKIKKRKQNSMNALQSIYEKTKPISRARKTKNSLKTGILSIDELKKQKQQEKQEKQEDQNGENDQQQIENQNEESQSNIENQENQQNVEVEVDENIQEINDVENGMAAGEKEKNEQIINKVQKAQVQNVEKIVQQQEGNNKIQQSCTLEKEEIKQNNEQVNPSKSSETVVIVDKKIETSNQPLNQ